MGKYDNIKTPKEAWGVASRLRKIRRIPEIEPLIIQDASASYNYAQKIIGDRWPEAEKTILNSDNIKVMFLYAKNVIKDRWPEAEVKILKDKKQVFKYINLVINKRWPEGEDVLLEMGIENIEERSNFWDCELMKYAKEYVQERWVEFEKIISKSPIALKEYAMEVLEDKLPEELHNLMIAYSIQYTDERDIKEYMDFVEEIKTSLRKHISNRTKNLNITLKDFLDNL